MTPLELWGATAIIATSLFFLMGIVSVYRADRFGRHLRTRPPRRQFGQLVQHVPYSARMLAKVVAKDWKTAIANFRTKYITKNGE